MFERVKKSNKKANIKLFTSIYEKMVELAENKDLQEIHKEQNKNINLKDFLYNFENRKTQEQIKQILEANKNIPQEILN